MADDGSSLSAHAARSRSASTVTFIGRDGVRRETALTNGVSVMEGARRYGIDGIEGDCGGACACATCHVYVEEGWFDRLPPMHELEKAMLDFAFDVKATSRLSCQIKVDESLDGLVVRVPERQY